MIRAILGLAGALAALFPDRAVDAFEAVALEETDAETKPWVGSAVRAEGVLAVAAGLLGGRASAWPANVTGVFGLVVFAVPRAYRAFAARLLYEEPDEVRWADRSTPLLRAVGAAYVLAALGAFRRRRRGRERGDDSGSEDPAERVEA
ncbi:hypothetical protein [Halorubrum halodurans]|uniref:Uncharacterized protein n=1 Tax=Halorubrum halodurans TaxID=1383851 RepID=A0A256IJJ6_9EURY|nr:hypothetical protein [Halorubrum halodurans]OYR56738.1 hypothetical protein DJ70_07460 [Halorubrum halodurans]